MPLSFRELILILFSALGCWFSGTAGRLPRRRLAAAGRRPGAARLPRPHLRPERHHRLQAGGRRFGLPRETGNDGGNASRDQHVHLSMVSLQKWNPTTFREDVFVLNWNSENLSLPHLFVDGSDPPSISTSPFRL